MAGPEPCRPVVAQEPSGGVRRLARYRSDREVPELWNRQPRRRPVLQRVRDAPGSDRRRGTRSIPFLPRELLAKLEAARAGRAMEGERRVVTMLFCDVKGSTAMAETLDAEDWAEIMNGAFERLIAPVYRYEGTLARLMGDAIFAFFGAPIAHEDDPQRAVWAGLDIISGIAGYKEQVQGRARAGSRRSGRHPHRPRDGRAGGFGPPPRVHRDGRCGERRGPHGADRRSRATVQITGGDAPAGRTASSTSRRAAGSRSRARPSPSRRTRVARPQGTSHGAIRGMRGSPLVGRDARDGASSRRRRGSASRAGDGSSRWSARPVSGKSRLDRRDARRVDAPATRRPATGDGGDIHRIWETWQCVSYDATRPYSQYRRMVARIAGIEDTDAPDVVRGKLAATIEHGRGGLARTAHARLAIAVRCHGAGRGGPGGRGVPRRDHGAGARRRPARSEPTSRGCMVFEDLHWCDEASMDVLIETAKLVDDLPCLFLFAFRPDRQAPSWRLKQWLETEYPHRSTELALTPLSERRQRTV